MHFYVVGGWPTPLRNLKFSWDDEIPKIWKTKTSSSHQQPVIQLSFVGVELNLVMLVIIRTSKTLVLRIKFKPPWWSACGSNLHPADPLKKDNFTDMLINKVSWTWAKHNYHSLVWTHNKLNTHSSDSLETFAKSNLSDITLLLP